MLLFVENINETKAKVFTIHYRPDLLTDEQKLNGILVDTIPEPQQIANQQATLYINPTTKELFYEYIEIPQQDVSNELETMRAEIARLQSELSRISGS